MEEYTVIPEVSSSRQASTGSKSVPTPEHIKQGASLMSMTDLKYMAKLYRWPAGITLALPAEGNHHFETFTGAVVVHQEALACGFRFPIHPFVQEILADLNAAPCQITPNSWKWITGFISVCMEAKLALRLKTFWQVHFAKGRNGFIAIGLAAGSNRYLKHIPSSIQGWKNNWFLVQFDEKVDPECSFGVENWNKLTRLNPDTHLSLEEWRITRFFAARDPDSYRVHVAETNLFAVEIGPCKSRPGLRLKNTNGNLLHLLPAPNSPCFNLKVAKSITWKNTPNGKKRPYSPSAESCPPQQKKIRWETPFPARPPGFPPREGGEENPIYLSGESSSDATSAASLDLGGGDYGTHNLSPENPAASEEVTCASIQAAADELDKTATVCDSETKLSSPSVCDSETKLSSSLLVSRLKALDEAEEQARQLLSENNKLKTMNQKLIKTNLDMVNQAAEFQSKVFRLTNERENLQKRLEESMVQTRLMKAEKEDVERTMRRDCVARTELARRDARRDLTLLKTGATRCFKQLTEFVKSRNLLYDFEGFTFDCTRTMGISIPEPKPEDEATGSVVVKLERSSKDLDADRLGGD